VNKEVPRGAKIQIIFKRTTTAPSPAISKKVTSKNFNDSCISKIKKINKISRDIKLPNLSFQFSRISLLLTAFKKIKTKNQLQQQ
jgi:hypothetical protein